MVQIQVNKGKTYAHIIPEMGGILSALVLQENEVIRCPVKGDDYQAGYPSALLFPFPSRIRAGKYTFEGKDYELPINEPARGNAIHGLICQAKFEVTFLSENTLIISYNYTGDIAGYPFPFIFEVKYELLDNGLILSYMATNSGNSNMPCAFGWHPYFCLGDSINDLSLEIPPTKEIVLDENMIAVSKSETIPARNIALKGITLDNGFEIISEGKTAKIVLSSIDKQLIIEQDLGNRKLNYLVIYTPPNRKSVAIEPQSANINAFNNQDALIILKPNKSISGSIKINLFNS